MTGLLDDVRSSIDDVLGVRDQLGAALKQVFIVTKVWSGSEPGDGTPVITRVEMSPSPRVVEYSDDYRIKEGGAVKGGDIVLKLISKQSYPTRADVDCSVANQKTEKFYEVGGALYRVINVREKHVTWNVQLRKVSNP